MTTMVTLRYAVPVYVEVNIGEGEVERVVVGDELIQSWIGDLSDLNEPVLVEADVSSPAQAEAARRLGEAIADEAEWPAWEFGW